MKMTCGLQPNYATAGCGNVWWILDGLATKMPRPKPLGMSWLPLVGQLRQLRAMRRQLELQTWLATHTCAKCGSVQSG